MSKGLRVIKANNNLAERPRQVEEFANRMHLKHDAANRIRNQVRSTAVEGITDFGQVDAQSFRVNKAGDMEFYRAEAHKALEALLKMYF